MSIPPIIPYPLISVMISKSFKENKPSKKYGDISFALLNKSSFSIISCIAKPAAIETGIAE